MKAVYVPNSSVAGHHLMHVAVQCHNRKQHFKLFIITHVHIHNSLKRPLLISLQTLMLTCNDSVDDHQYYTSRIITKHTLNTACMLSLGTKVQQYNMAKFITQKCFLCIQQNPHLDHIPMSVFNTIKKSFTDIDKQPATAIL